MGFLNSFDLAALMFALLQGVEGHGRLTVPVARNGGDNGAVAGGPGTVYAGGVESNYKHGICGNGPGQPQQFNEVGPIKATYVEGQTVNFEVQITAHHIGFFEFDLCTDAGKLSEECFAEHHLLRAGCDCDCPDDPSNSCENCLECRRWWKPLVEGEVGYWPARGYAEQGSVVLPGAGNLRVYNFVMSYMIPIGTKSKNAVVRWHYMTTNSCTSGGSAPEEFWNCADIMIRDTSNQGLPNVEYSNDELRALPVENLVPKITAGKLPGVMSGCPVDGTGQLQGIGNADAYMFCGDEVPRNQRSYGNLGPYEFCNSPEHRQTENCGLNSAGILCDGEWFYFQCIDGNTDLQPVPVGQCCKGNQFVPEIECKEQGPSPPPTPKPPAVPVGDCAKFGSPALVGNVNGCTDSYCQTCSEGYSYWPCNLDPPCCTCVEKVGDGDNSTTTTTQASEDCSSWCADDPHSLQVKCYEYENCAGCDFCEGVPEPPDDCHGWCEGNTKPVATKCTFVQCMGCSWCDSVDPPTPPPPAPNGCEDLNGKACTACLASNNVCYDEPKSWCDLWPSYEWCGNTGFSSCSHWPDYAYCGYTKLFGDGASVPQSVPSALATVATVGVVLGILGVVTVGFRSYQRRRALSSHEARPIELLTSELDTTTNE